MNNFKTLEKHAVNWWIILFTLRTTVPSSNAVNTDRTTKTKTRDKILIRLTST